MNRVVELFGVPTVSQEADWKGIVESQKCPFTGRTCYKVRKSEPNVSIGTCIVSHGRFEAPLIICPARFLKQRQIFTDCLHLLTLHEPGNELHIVSEVFVPGGSVDYFLVSVREGQVKDFVGIEVQAVDTTGTVWDARQQFLQEVGVVVPGTSPSLQRRYGVNWKMTAKTTLVQMFHKVETFENISKRLVLVVQEQLLEYMQTEFDFTHLHAPARVGDSFHLHAYRLASRENSSLTLDLYMRLSTDAAGVARCLGLRAEVKVELEQIVKALQARISEATRFSPV
jgi:hypothetical protein